jgi:hypothetical protein
VSLLLPELTSLMPGDEIMMCGYVVLGFPFGLSDNVEAAVIGRLCSSYGSCN